MIFKKVEIQTNRNTVGEMSDVIPKLYAYIPHNSMEIDPKRKRKTVIICPGGGYELTSDREAEPIALKFVAEDFNAFVLRYSVFPATFPTALCELATAVAMLRENKEEWNIDENYIIVAGFSAGGHLAASIGSLWHTEFLEQQMGMQKELYKPNGLILSYPVISSGEFAHKSSFKKLLGNSIQYENLVSIEKNITKHMPPAFIWHTFDDATVPVENSLLLAMEMKKNNIPIELHIYPQGVHGLSLASVQTSKDENEESVNAYCQSWFEFCIKWLKRL